jgi:hypothetical protein
MADNAATKPEVDKAQVAAALQDEAARLANLPDALSVEATADLFADLRDRFVPKMVPMSTIMRCAVAAWLVTVGVATFVGIVWIWRVVEQLTLATGEQLAAKQIDWIGPDFVVTESSATLVLVALAAAGGSVVHMVTVFTHRAGRGTLEARYAPWYLLRPIASAVLGVLFCLAIGAGLTTVGAPESQPAFTTLVVFGSLAGLFTDRVIQQMLRLLGSTDPTRPAIEQELPHVTPATSSS